MLKIVYNEAITKGETECPICQQEYIEGEQLEITECGHFYHQDCIVEWFKMEGGRNHGTCPTCRSVLKISVHPEIAEINKKLEKVGLGFKTKKFRRND
ncbi:unnamed protein product [Meloidogyne enterolobii]|uniref:Uncharacterized protein n=1 Tax=Meloidogyne enterolobii TaxID=390850 RepID=A0ACB1A0H9_MELEN